MARWPAIALAVFGAVLVAIDPPAPAAAAGSFLYATTRACASSGVFRRRECEIAFANAQTELQERTERFASRGRCEARYRLCERATSEEETIYRPALLGIEIAGGRDRWSAAPVLGIETPRLFAGRPITRLVAPRPMTDRWTQIMPGGRFRLGGARQTASMEQFDTPDMAIDMAMEAPEPAPAAIATRESASARRERLRSAPYIQ